MLGLNSINTTDEQQALTRAFGLRERAPCPTIAPEIQPVVLVKDLTTSPPFDKQRYAGGGSNVTGGAAAASIELRNPATSGVLARVSKIIVGGAISQAFDYMIGANGLGVDLGTPSRSWLNTELNGEPALILAAGDATVLSIFHSMNMLGQGFPYTLDTPIILTPGFSVKVTSQSIGTTIFIAYIWQEFLLTSTL